VTASAEHLVLGSGAGGALTAALLAEAGRDVLVLEEGPWIEQDSVEPFSLEQMVRQYRHGGVSAALGRPPVSYVEGRCAGGSTEVNAALYHLASEATLARWRESHHVRDLDPDVLAPHAAAVERALSVQQLPHPAPPASLVLARGAAACGLEAIEVPRFYRYDNGRPAKQSMTRTYLPRARAAGARLLCDTRVKRVVIRSGRAAGAETSRGLITAEHVWCCCGAIGTAALLHRSGVRRAVGTALSMHPTVKLAARFDEPLEAGTEVPVHQVKPGGGEISFGGSASRPGQLALALAEDWRNNRAVAERWREMAVYYAAIRPEGRGRVLTPPAARDPLVTFALTRRDMRLLAGGLVQLARLLFAAGARAVYPSVRGGGEVTRARDADRIAGMVTRSAAAVMTVHLFSTVPIGEDEARCPVDSYGAVRGVRALRVNDASLLPDAPGVNPQGTVMAIASRNVAAFLAADERGRDG
jgi:choline dehydrogenase-like flavoprotein